MERRDLHRLRSAARQLIPLSSALSQRGLLEPIKTAYDRHGWMAGSITTLPDQISMPAVS